MREFRPFPKPPPREKKPKKPIPRISKKKLDEIERAKLYYTNAINDNTIANKGVCKCEECGSPITAPRGNNVCHVVGQGAYSKLYFERINHFILCKKCSNIEQNGDRKSMKIYHEWERRRLILLQSLIPEHRK